MKTAAKVLWVTGSDTGVGKTVVATALVRSLAADGHEVRGVKPFCSGGAGDVEAMVRAMGGGVDACDVTPWLFREALSPLVAARRLRKRISRAEVLRFLRNAGARCDLLVVEGAGGLLSPLGETFDARDLIRLQGSRVERVVVVVPNRLGAMNQALLAAEVLGSSLRSRLRIALVSPVRHSVASRTNLDVLRERLGGGVVVPFPWLKTPQGGRVEDQKAARIAIDRLLE